MTDLKKRIAALSLAASLLISATGCSNNSIKRKLDNNNKITYSGEANLKGINNLYIVVLTDINNERMFYLTERSIDNFFNGFEYEYLLLGTSDELTDQFCGYTTSYGKVENIIPFSQFLPVYARNLINNDEFKDKYSAEDILSIFECIKEDYEDLIQNENVKKLELK